MKEIFTSSTYADLSAKIEEFMENHEVYDWPLVTIITEKVDEPNGDYHWEATLMPKDARNTMEDLLVEEHGLVRFFFTEEDIEGRVEYLYNDDIIPVNELTKEQMEHVKHVLSNCDAEYGLSWDAIDGSITDLFDDDSDPDEACERDRELHGTDGYENIEEEYDSGIEYLRSIGKK